ncbi:biotin--[acetyl-CoA-carboxylase] ligase [cyanobacterium TDX16]|nr:biotin--[acetyl-CoA-carboxylase] ligase [cyanobacterium TDX16]
MRPGRPNDRLVGLTGTRFEQVEWVGETGSTNADLLARARAGASDGLVLVADHQAAGRGRLGRSWEAPPGASLLVSVLLRPDVPLARAHLLTVALGLAAVEALEELAEVPAALKWPNDVVVPDSQVGDGPIDRKLGGILAESVVEDGSLAAVVVGMGLNVAWPPVLPAELATIAVAANHVSDVALDRADLLVAILVRFERLLADLDDEAGTAELRRRYLERCRTIGRDVRVELADGSFTGRADDVTDEGHLVVTTPHGRREVTAGDVVHLRPAGPTTT